MAREFDLIVIGSGSAATTAAHRCRQAGWSVAIVDSRPFGGTCALRGCDPKKVLVGAAEVVDRARRMAGQGIRANGLQLDWPELMRFQRTFTDPIPAERERNFAAAGIAALRQRAHFTGPNSMAAGDERLTARHILIAAGQKPADLKIPGQEFTIDSEQFLKLERLPSSLLFIGGGYIAFEFAHIAARAGARATILHRGARPLEHFDPDLVAQLAQYSRELGITIELGAEVQAVERQAGQYAAHARTGSGERNWQAEVIVNAAGRVADIDDMNLDAADIEWSPQGVKVNPFLQSVSNPMVYAAGDAAASGGPPLTPVAGYEGGIAAENLLQGNHKPTDYRGVPTAVYTIPPLTAAGLSEQDARERGLKFRVHRETTAGWYSSRRTGETCSGFKVLIEEGSDRILGAHVLGEQADEIINLFALAIRTGMATAELQHLLYAYPTHGSDIPYML